MTKNGLLQRKAGSPLLLSLFFSLLLLSACAQKTLDIDESQTIPQQEAEAVVFPPYEGEKIPIAVFPMGLSEKAAQRYPHLLEKSVGLGLDNVLADTIYQTRRYRLVEANEAVINESLNRIMMSASGLMDEQHALRIGKILGAKKIIYGEVFDYSEGKEESVAGLKAVTTPRIRVGIQLRMVDTETLEYVPASSVKYGRDWSEASQAAIGNAVLKLITGGRD